MSIPNFFTGLRILLAPLFGWLWWSGRHAAALGVFCLAAVTDVLDGLLARVLDQRTRLGAVLDPAADKLMLLVAFLVAASLGAVPWWLAFLVIGRDLVLSLGAGLFAWVLRGRHDARDWQPSRLGKYATFFQLTTIAMALAARLGRGGELRRWVGSLVLLTALFTVVSGLQYVTRALVALLRLAGTSPLRGTA